MCLDSYEDYTSRPHFAGTINGTPGAESSSSFVPSAELSRTDADIFIVFLSGHGVYFGEPVYDEWYRATASFATMRNILDDGSLQIYRTSEAASPLGCASQWQFCNTNTSACGPTTSLYDAMSRSLEAFGVSGNESIPNRSPAKDRLEWLMATLGTETMNEAAVLRHQQDNALMSKQSLFQGYQGPIPDDQWQLDVTNWFSIYLAIMQSNLLQTASGFMEAQSGLNATRPDTDAARRLCSNQVTMFPNTLTCLTSKLTFGFRKFEQHAIHPSASLGSCSHIF